jgi:RNA-directed DNA polymerase
MSENRQNQGGLALRNEPKGEARKPTEGTAARVAKRAAESPAPTDKLMEEVVEGENLKRAWKRVKANQGSPGVDGMTVFALKDYLNEHWPAIREQLLTGKYQPAPVLRVEIEKPEGGMRKLG